MQLDFGSGPGRLKAKITNLIGFITKGESIVKFDDSVLLETEDIIEIKTARQRFTNRIGHAFRRGNLGNRVWTFGIIPTYPFL